MEGLNNLTLPPNEVSIDSMDHARGSRHPSVEPDTSSESQSELTVSSDTGCQLEQGLNMTRRHHYLGDNLDQDLDVN